MRYVPEWFPFIKFKKQAAEWRRKLDRGVTKPFEKVRAEMVSLALVQIKPFTNMLGLQSSGQARPSFTTRMLEDPSHGLSVQAMRWLSGIICECHCLRLLDTQCSPAVLPLRRCRCRSQYFGTFVDFPSGNGPPPRRAKEGARGDRSCRWG